MYDTRQLGIFTAPKSRYEDEMFKCHNEGDIQEEGSVMENIERLNGIDIEEESIMRKRKSAEIENDERSMMNSHEDEYKRTKRENKDVHVVAPLD
ncbi:hypothetical protein Goklo_006808 [Gossypium klotzschianum]|uniref:Uncharacterized protein n=1 Tax=Gossypium klotzschianum TaxID=34286 RepID=A0A7J8VJD1_9ROSI|nr:hypothetical protein [Gossypium klotzschianum]